MFNEILTGKASLEPKSAPPPTAPPAPAAPVPAAVVQANQAQSAAALHAASLGARRNDASHNLFRVIVLVVVAIGLGFFRYGMRKQEREDAAQAAGYRNYGEYERERAAVYPTDEYSYKVSQFADEMCRCSDLACSRDVLAQFSRYLRSGTPSDDKASESVAADSQRLYDCAAKFENAR